MSHQEIEELRRRLEEAERRQTEAERQTTLPEFLDACHAHLFLGLTVQEDRDSSTKGDPANVDDKLRPDKIREWTGFPKEQVAIWKDIMDTAFVTERHFSPLLALKVLGKEVRERMLSSELDLSYFERQTVESRVASVVKQLHSNPRLRQIFCLNGDVTFENHANTLTDESKVVADMESLSLTQEQPRRSGCLAAKQSGKVRLLPPAQSPARSQRATPPRQSRPRADQFCVYNKGPGGKVPGFIIEYKAPHKLSLAHINAGLQDMEVDQVVRYQQDETPEDICRRVVAAVITQTFSYMIKGGLEYGYVCTGEAFIFLRVLPDDPSTAYYYLSVPKEDVGETTGWTGDLNDDNRLHLTALGQGLAFTLRALRTPPRGTGWTNWAVTRLATWEMVYDDLLGEISEQNVPSSDFKPSSKYALANVASCNPSQGPTSSDLGDDSSDEFDSNTPSRRPPHCSFTQLPALSSLSTGTTQSQRGSRSKGKSRQYCTQQCLLGLRTTWGSLDRECPNVLDHGVDRHQIDLAMLIRLLDDQLSTDALWPNMDLGCESLHIHGTRGALFKVTLLSHGYTFVAKGSPIEFAESSKHEEVFVPVLVGSLVLRRSFSYDGIAEVVHLMFMGYAGETLAKRGEIDRHRLVRQAENALHAIHRLGVLHNGPILGNMIWNEETSHVMFIDFERARFQKRRAPLGPISPNQKRKREICTLDSSPNKRSTTFERETQRMRHGLES
ncbi:hypothetical protein PENDEC_c036G01700 [Penicillium decumbens]|uniref:Aminoglycoside phosphotransferase domain-containing protein n=1 Tax=Penicillium decumbens TaxID=69771 RepID=A0A1V6NUX8_PENDC|nr:hypothetical protein PENDEC_c036G01700 [Penicillium decumbens]